MCQPTDMPTSLSTSQMINECAPKKRRVRRRRRRSKRTEENNSLESGTQSNTISSQSKPKYNGRRRRQTDSKINENISEEERNRFVALDCEMVGVGPGGYYSALARVCIIDWYDQILLDTYVKVAQPITDYRTFVSGIREEDLQSNHAMEMRECRALVSSILEGKIVIGHALRNDFKAMKINHPWYDTRDTAKYKPLMKICERTGALKARKLRDLVFEKLNKEIQCEGIEHCPFEDASAVLALYKSVENKWEKVVKYNVSKTKELTQKTDSSSSDLSEEDYENILEFFASQ